MLPGLQPGELVLTLPLRGRPTLGDVVIADVPGVGPTVKRIIASPKQDVRLDEGHLALDGVWHHEVYATTSDDGHHHLPPGDGWVLLGDNRPSSTDSRRFGRVPREAITRRVVLRVRDRRRQQLPAAARPGPRERACARLLVIDDSDRALLFCVDFRANGGGNVWMTPGGGIAFGESVATAAYRELAEEVGLAAVSLRVLDRLPTRRHGRSHEATFEHLDHWVAVRVDHGQISGDDWTQQEQDEIVATRWFTTDDLAALIASDETVIPANIDELVTIALASV